MTATLPQLAKWMTEKEAEHLEFKEAKNNFHFEKLVKYCAALANEKGGVIVLGVTDKRPRRVVGCQALANLERTKAGIVERLRLKVEGTELAHPDGRVLVFEVPARPVGMPISVEGAFWMRSGEDLVPMTTDQLKRIVDESDPDYSASICPRAVRADLDSNGIDWLRRAWHKKSGNERLLALSDDRLLEDAELTVRGGISYAALILVGRREALGRHLSQAEVIFEYRASEGSIPSQQRKEYREGFFLFHEDLWNTINLRNEVQQLRDGLFMRDISTFNEAVVREALLNAISHRDYRLGGSVFVRQFPCKLEIVSPGGFPPGITAQNILFRQSPRNRRVAEVLARCGLVERSGQGADRMFDESLREGKPRPDFTGTDDYQVCVTLRGQVDNPQFLTFLEQVSKELQLSFSAQDLVLLDIVQRHESIPADLNNRAQGLRDIGVLEATGHGKGQRFILSRRFHKFLGKPGAYTRKRGLDRETNKALLLKHLENFPTASIRDFEQILPHLSRRQLHSLLVDLKDTGKVRRVGEKRGSQWAKVG